MIKFAAKSHSGQQVLGIGLGDIDLMKLKLGEPVALSLDSVRVGLWVKNDDGTRSFLQPRDCQVIIFPGDQPEDIGQLLGVKMPSLDEIRKRAE